MACVAVTFVLPLSSDTLLSSPTTAAYKGSGLYDFALCVNAGGRWVCGSQQDQF